MHILPVYFTTTNTRKRKKPKKPASLIEAERQHAKFIKKMGIGIRSSVGIEQRSSKPWVTGSSPVECANKRSVAQPGSAPALGAGGQRFESSHSDQIPLSNDIPVGVAPKKELIPHNFTIAPAYNKGPYQVISKSNIKDIGR
jgi:hypothetical protein|tara:strand:+ start:154 stop:579 length:426 start_codon:yes stop_codon:yes gene_type:complete